MGSRRPLTESRGVWSTPASSASLMSALTMSLVAWVAAQAAMASLSRPARLAAAFSRVSSVVGERPSWVSKTPAAYLKKASLDCFWTQTP